MTATTELELKVGRTYRAKRPAPAGGGWQREVNDRTVLWVGAAEVQYDGPSVARGRHYPRMPIDAFRKWADRDVTNELPPGEYATWPPKKQGT